MIELGHFGLHWLPGQIAVLLQGSGSETAIGLEVEAKHVGRGRCNHRINLRAQAELPDIVSDPLVKALRPVPRRGRVPWIEQQDLPLHELARMSSPIQPVIRPLWTLTSHQIQQELLTTNIQPLILVDVAPNHRAHLDRAISLAKSSPRPVLLVGSPLVPQRPDMERIETQITGDISHLNWEAIGATILRNHMLRISE